MSQYAHLSTIDPEFDAYLKANPQPILPPPTDIAVIRELFTKQIEPYMSSFQEARLSPDAKYQIKDFKIPVEGGEIAARAIIPGTGEEGKKYPLLFNTHGGGFLLGGISTDDYFLRNISTELQVTTLNVAYRVAPEYPYPVPVNDSYAALKWAVNNADALAADLKKGFVVGGTSAGANLAAVLALRARDDPFFRDVPITGQYLACATLIHIDAQSKFPDELLSLEQNKDAPEFKKANHVNLSRAYNATPTDQDASPILASSHANLPPAFLQACGLDPLRDESFLYERLLREAGNKTRIIAYPGVSHGFWLTHADLTLAKKFEVDIREGLRWLFGQTTA
ncbi:Alpha/Beta hydrolase protein [Gloeopeniophorella convolvens]|nr:Alpha/Beta hydrolase protein [Gloeopeniophorella convolvens]